MCVSLSLSLSLSVSERAHFVPSPLAALREKMTTLASASRKSLTLPSTTRKRLANHLDLAKAHPYVHSFSVSFSFLLQPPCGASALSTLPASRLLAVACLASRLQKHFDLQIALHSKTWSSLVLVRCSQRPCFLSFIHSFSFFLSPTMQSFPCACLHSASLHPHLTPFPS